MDADPENDRYLKPPYRVLLPDDTARRQREIMRPAGYGTQNRQLAPQIEAGWAQEILSRPAAFERADPLGDILRFKAAAGAGMTCTYPEPDALVLASLGGCPLPCPPGVKGVLRRETKRKVLPVISWKDEAQYFRRTGRLRSLRSGLPWRRRVRLRMSRLLFRGR